MRVKNNATLFFIISLPENLFISLEIWTIFYYRDIILIIVKQFDIVPAFYDIRYFLEYVESSEKSSELFYFPMPYFFFMRESFSESGFAIKKRKTTVASEWTMSNAKPVT